MGVAQLRTVRDDRSRRLLIGGLDGEHRVRIDSRVTARAIR